MTATTPTFDEFQKFSKEHLEALVELSEQISLVRGEALRILGKKP